MKSVFLPLALMAASCDNPPEQTAQNVSEPQQNVQQPGQQQGNMKGGYPEKEGEIIQNSTLLRYNNSGEGDPDPEYTQSQLSSMSHVTISGNIICSGTDCNGQMIMRVQPFFEGRPGEKRHESGGSIMTRKIVTESGAYSILCPKSKNPVRMELHVDSNGDGKPTEGERFAVLERGGMMIPNEDLKNMDFDVTDRPETGPMGGPANPDSPTPKPQD